MMVASGDKPMVMAVDDVCSFIFDSTGLTIAIERPITKSAPPRPPPEPKNTVIVSLPRGKETMARHTVRHIARGELSTNGG